MQPSNLLSFIAALRFQLAATFLHGLALNLSLGPFLHLDDTDSLGFCRGCLCTNLIRIKIK